MNKKIKWSEVHHSELDKVVRKYKLTPYYSPDENIMYYRANKESAPLARMFWPLKTDINKVYYILATLKNT